MAIVAGHLRSLDMQLVIEGNGLHRGGRCRWSGGGRRATILRGHGYGKAEQYDKHQEKLLHAKPSLPEVPFPGKTAR
jgi:hypothetical protein